MSLMVQNTQQAQKRTETIIQQGLNKGRPTSVFIYNVTTDNIFIVTIDVMLVCTLFYA